MIQFNPTVIWMTLSFAMAMLIWMVSNMFLKSDSTINANEPFECGLEPISSNRPPFCMHFFLVGILFLVFDIELIVSLPMIMVGVNLMEWLLFWKILMFILLIGLIAEIMIGTLDWKE